jgi:hypothetical protein
MAQDKGTTPMQSSILVVDIEVLDTNDNSPKFTKEIYTRNILESSSIGSFVEEVQAIDADIGVNAQVVYSLMSGTDYFKIENETGMFLNYLKSLTIGQNMKYKDFLRNSFTQGLQELKSFNTKLFFLQVGNFLFQESYQQSLPWTEKVFRLST